MGKGLSYSATENAYIARNYRKMTDREIGARLGRSRKGICEQRQKLRLGKYGEDRDKRQFRVDQHVKPCPLSLSPEQVAAIRGMDAEAAMMRVMEQRGLM